MQLSDFSYHLPKDRIAQKPMRPRDHSRLLVLNRQKTQLAHRHFYNIVDYLQKGDVLVFNNSKVFPARLPGKKISGGNMEVFLLRSISPDTWECLLRGKGAKPGLEMNIVGVKAAQDGHLPFRGVVKKSSGNGIWWIQFNFRGKKLQNAIEQYGEAPTPPYVKRLSNLKEYQTVFAQKTGSVAAPTAGFHFTKSIMQSLGRKGVQIEYVTLHVGYGTFAPIKVNDVRWHRIHGEWIEVDKATHSRLVQAKKQGRRIIAVGTTSVRTLESLPKKPQYTHKEVYTYIYPGYHFKMVDAMITNFHVPGSSLLVLVSAFAGRENILKAYQIAVKKKYRFYSFGDAMLIL
ncbi:MAG: tRNA preQ1(34) S-adenosylmethionine ribosyltransferase-isomerase QueA [Candidatus Nomurabacteria bacterium]|nr:MAG: tRNA preQ1(34) S-adenosylmethionine ribosyltransferase-isomerase QueA [Candidatus Nomurabacteria bacterium]